MPVDMNDPMIKQDGVPGEQCVYSACCCCTDSFDCNNCKPACDANCLAMFCGCTNKGASE